VGSPRSRTSTRNVRRSPDMTEDRVAWPVLGVVAAVVIIIVLVLT
jgi:hypothetical protein